MPRRAHPAPLCRFPTRPANESRLAVYSLRLFTRFVLVDPMLHSKILVVEDDNKVGALLQRALTEEGFVVDRVRTIADAISHASHLSYDLAVVDRLLPDGDGVTLCKRFRDLAYPAPVLMLTAMAETSDKVRALDDGADDYVTKPFSLDELFARARVLIRRGAVGKLMLQAGPVALDIRTRTATVSGRRIELTTKEFVLLELLVRRAGEVATRSELLANVWNVTADPGSNVVEVHIKKLRDKLGEAATCIETVRSRGYRFNCGDRRE